MGNTVKKRKRKRNRGKKILWIILIIVFLLAAVFSAVYLLRQRKTPDTEPDKKNEETIQPAQGEDTQVRQTISGESGSPQDPEQDGTLGQTGYDGTFAEVQEYINRMSLEEKIAQLFVVTPEALTNMDLVIAQGEITQDAINRYPVGGLVYFQSNILSEEQFADMVQNVQRYSMDRSSLPLFICIDEEGGTVARITGRGMVGVPDIPDMYDIGATGDTAAAYNAGSQIGRYLSRFGINVDFAPVADLYSETNPVIGTRAFGSNPVLVASMVENEVLGLKEQNVAAALKHFPGHGSTNEDSHYGGAYCYKTLDELRNAELIPFQAGIDAGADFVMAGHISLPNILGDNTPASLSYMMITEVLRNEMGFQGIVITDSLSMGAIANIYGSAEAAVYAVQAGVDILLMPSDFVGAYNGLLEAVQQGLIDEMRINQSLERILRLKIIYSGAN